MPSPRYAAGEVRRPAASPAELALQLLAIFLEALHDRLCLRPGVSAHAIYLAAPVVTVLPPCVFDCDIDLIAATTVFQCRFLEAKGGQVLQSPRSCQGKGTGPASKLANDRYAI